MKNKDEDIEILKNPHKMELTQLIRTFKREGIENFVTVRKENLENVLSELETYKKIAYFLGARYWLKDCEYADKFEKLEDVLDWARNEVENESSN